MDDFIPGLLCGLMIMGVVLWIIARYMPTVPKKLYVVTVDSWNGTYSRVTVVDVYSDEERAKAYCRRMNKGNTSSYAPVYSYETCDLDEGQ